MIVTKNYLIADERNPQASHKKRKDDSMCYYFLIKEQEGSLSSNNLGHLYQKRKKRSGIWGGGTES